MELAVNITKKYKDFKLEVEFNTGQEILGILGASGSGKSLTLRSIAGILTPDQGKIVLNGKVLFDSAKGINLPVQERRVGLLFQNYALFPNLTVRENIAFGIRKLPGREQVRRIEEKMAVMQISHLCDKYPWQLSGGEQQRTALARTLVTEPQCLLLDEPFSALDNHIRGHLEKELLDLLSTYEGVTLFVTHNLEECYRVSKNILVVDRGRVLACGCRDDVFMSPPDVRTARLTGCKNLSVLRRIDTYTILAEDWGCELKTGGQEIDGCTYVGIREHNVNLVADGDSPNTFPCQVIRLVQTPFAVTCFLKIAHGCHSASKEIQTEISKEKFAEFKGSSSSWYIQLRPEHLFFMKG